MTEQSPRPARWYHEPYAWLVFGIPGGTVVAGIVMIMIASSNSDGLVADDYYKQGLEINRVLDREARALALGLKLEVGRIGNEDFAFLLHVADGAPDALPAEVLVRFLHATRAAGDQAVTAEHLGGGHYRGRLERLSQGPWYVEVSTSEWRLVQRVLINAAGTRPGTAPR